MTNSDGGDGSWHLDKRVSWGHIATTVAMIISVVIWSLQLHARAEVNALRIDQMEKNVERLRNETQAQYGVLRHDGQTQYSEIIRRLERLDQKIDEQGSP